MLSPVFFCCLHFGVYNEHLTSESEKVPEPTITAKHIAIFSLVFCASWKIFLGNSFCGKRIKNCDICLILFPGGD